MKRYKIIGSYSSKKVPDLICDNHNVISISLAQNGEFSCFGMDHVMCVLKKLDIYPMEKSYDLIALALLVYIADTRISRKEHGQDSWTREIFLELPVKYSEMWNNCKRRINKILRFLTGDIWKISFTERNIDFSTEVNDKTIFYDAISLFSGGMDSLISTINLLEDGKNILLAAHANEGLVKKAQTDIIQNLDKEYPEETHTLVDLWTSIPKDIISEGGEENTTRSRSFLFISYAVFIATGTENLKELFIPENGLIAINVPMDSMRVGAHSTRTTHPYYLSLWNELLRELGFEFSIKNPFWNKTKGEMASECKNKELLYHLMPLSMSCSSPGKERYNGLAPQHCGYCLPCIIRRAAMHKAFEEDNTTYANLSVSAMVNERQQEKGKQMRSIQYAIERVKEDPEFAKYAIYKPGPLKNDSEFLNGLADVYARGLMEVDKWIQNSLERENAN